MDLISRQISNGTWLRLTTDFSEIPIEGELIDHDDHFLLIADRNEGCSRLVALSHVLMCSLTEKATAGSRASGSGAGKQEDASADMAGTEETQTHAGQEKDGTSADSGEELYRASEVSIPGVKVVGKINLDTFRTPGKRQPFNKPEPKNEPRHIPYELASLPLIANGTIKSIGPHFGFVTDDDGNDHHFKDTEALTHLQPGDRVIFSNVVTKYGNNAIAVHDSSTISQALGVIRRCLRNGKRVSAANIKQQILEEYPNNEELATILENIDNGPRKPKETPVPLDNFNDNPAKTETHLAQELLPDRYEEYVAQVEDLIDGMENADNPFDRRYLHRTYTRLIKNAREEDRRRFALRASNFYRRIGEFKSSQFFDHMATKHQQPEPNGDNMIRLWTGGLRKQNRIDPYTSELIRRHILTEGFDMQDVNDRAVSRDDVEALRERIDSGETRDPKALLTLIKLTGIMNGNYDPCEDLLRYYTLVYDRLLEEGGDRELLIFNFERILRYTRDKDFEADSERIGLQALMTVAGAGRDEILAPDSHIYDTSVLSKMETGNLPDLHTRLSRLADSSKSMREYLSMKLSEAGMDPLPRMTRRGMPGQRYRLVTGETLEGVTDRFNDYLNEFLAVDGTIESERRMTREITGRLFPAINDCLEEEADAETFEKALATVNDLLDNEEAHRSDLSFAVLRPIIDALRLALRREQRRRIPSGQDTFEMEEDDTDDNDNGNRTDLTAETTPEVIPETGETAGTEDDNEMQE